MHTKAQGEGMTHLLSLCLAASAAAAACLCSTVCAALHHTKCSTGRATADSSLTRCWRIAVHDAQEEHEQEEEFPILWLAEEMKI